MSIGLGVVLIVIGAILSFAIDPSFFESAGINVEMIGYILIGAGAFVVLFGIVMLFRRRSVETRTTIDPSTGSRVTRSDATDDSAMY